MAFDESPRSRVRVEPSAAIELCWLLLACGKREAIESVDPGLLKRADGFWGDGLHVDVEILVLASALECLTGWDIDPILTLGRRPLPPIPEPGLRTETPELRVAIPARLDRLSREAKLRARYGALLADAWECGSAAWRDLGRPTVERLLARWSASIDHGQRPDELIPADHIARRAPYDAMCEGARAAGRLLLTPCYFAQNHGHVVELQGGLVSVAVGAGVGADGARRRSEAERVARGLKLLSDPTRVMILTELERESATVGEIATRVGVAQPTASAHIRQLRDAGLISADRSGTTARYRVAPDRLGAILADARTTLLDGR